MDFKISLLTYSNLPKNILALKFMKIRAKHNFFKIKIF